MPVIRLRLLGGVDLSTHENGRDRRLSVAPKQLALLAYLAVAEGAPVRRDVLLGLFWPELPTDHARAALRQLLFQLRRSVGDGALQCDRESIAVAAEALCCDVVTFEQRLARGDRAGAMETYRGPLLAGFFADGVSAAFEQWIDGARVRLSGQAYVACTILADDAERTGNGIAAAQWARAAAALAPDNEMAIRRLIKTLDNFGDRYGALRVADDFARRLSDEFDAAPSAETQATIAAVRARCAALDMSVADAPRSRPNVLVATELDAEQGATPSQLVVARGSSLRRRWPSLRRPLLVASVAGTLIAVAIVGTRRGGATTDLGAPWRVQSPPITVAAAWRGLYEQGLDRYYAGDMRESARLLTAAVAGDRGCAMCAYYAGMADASFDDSASVRMLQLANRLSARVSEPERLLIHYRWEDATNSFARHAVADSLVARYPNWPEAQVAAAEAADMSGAWLAAADHLRRAIAGEPLADAASTASCPACESQRVLVTTYDAADSLAAALRVAQALVRAQPHSRLAWLSFSHALGASGRFDDARAALDSSTLYASGTNDDAIEHAQIEIRAGNFATADRLLTTLAQTGTANSRSDALWYLVISLRTQGRLGDALGVAQGPFRTAVASSTQGVGISFVAEAQVLFEMGQYRRAAAIFAANAWPPDAFGRAAEGRIARQRAWMLTHAGSALAAVGDTAAVAALADTVELWGRRSGFGRDPRLHEYLRGLLWTARGRSDSAVEAYRRATFSETEGFSRLQFERARAFLDLGRPQEAISALRYPLAGGLDAGNFYVTPTELEDLLARAYDAAGERDSAAVYYRRVVSAWRGADARFQARVAYARDRLAIDEEHAIARR